jgi:hypothetical protein
LTLHRAPGGANAKQHTIGEALTSSPDAHCSAVALVFAVGRDAQVVDCLGQWPSWCRQNSLAGKLLDQCNAAGVWYRVDAGDADPWSFFGLLAQTLESDVSVPMAPINCEQTSDITSFARQFFRSFFARSSARSVIVLDNFERAPNLASLLRQALRRIPAGMSILVASRAGPPSVLADMSLTADRTS